MQNHSQKGNECDYSKFLGDVFEFSFLMQICEVNNHELCQKLKGLVILKILMKSKENNVIDKIFNHKFFVSKRILKGILKQLSFSMNYSKKTIGTLVVNQINSNLSQF